MTIIGEKPEDECWDWPRSTNNAWGYGQIAIVLPDGKRRRGVVHRITYEGFVGPIPEGMVIDHLCRRPICCNPAHLEAVTEQVNIAERGMAPSAIRYRTGVCGRGHPKTPAYGVMRPNGLWRCRRCAADYTMARAHAKAAAEGRTMRPRRRKYAA